MAYCVTVTDVPCTVILHFSESNALTTNRGNFLLRDILSKRYPKIFVGEYEQRALLAYLARDRSRQGN